VSRPPRASWALAESVQREGRRIGKRATRVIGVRPANRPDFDPAEKPLLQTIDQLAVTA